MIIDRFVFTNHAKSKMRHYGISESLVRRVVRFPDRVEEAIVTDLIAAMKRTRSKTYPEVWVMYQVLKEDSGKLKIITAWRYPGISDLRDPIPENIYKEVRSIIGF